MEIARTIKTGKDVWALVFLEDGKHLLSGGREEIIRQWNVEDGREIEDQRLTASDHSQVSFIVLSSDGKWIVSGGRKVVTVWNRKSRQPAFTASEHSDWIHGAHVSPDSTRFATASDDWRVIIWNIWNGKPLFEPLQHRNVVDSVRFSPDGNRVATAVRGGEARIYNAHNGQLLGCIAVTLSRTNPIAWSGDSQHIFVLSSHNVIKHIYVDTPTFLSEWIIPGQPHDYNYISLSNNGRFIAAFVGGSLTFWDTSARAQLAPVFEHAEAPRLYSMALSEDSNYIATGGYGGIITLRKLSDIIPISYLHGVDRNVGRSVDTQGQIEVLRSTLRALELRYVDSQFPATLQRIPNGTYRIKSRIHDLYLAGPEAGAGTVVAQPLDLSSSYQKWTVSLVDDGAYDIVNDSRLWLTELFCAPLVSGQKGTTWTFEPRGDAYVIGNATNATAIQLERDLRSVSVLSRNNSTYQRWVLQPVTNGADASNELQTSETVLAKVSLSTRAHA